MATITAINSKKSQTHAGLKAIMQYAVQFKKTLYEGEILADGVNCVPDYNYLAYDEFINTKREFGKDNGKMYFQFVLSHSPDEIVSPKAAHEMAMDFAKTYFNNYEVLVATHTDAMHIHSHLIVNSVSFTNGKKYNSGPTEINAMHDLCDRLCEQYGFSICEKSNHEYSYHTKQSEYHSMLRNESWKEELRKTIDNCMQYAVSKSGFFELMKSEGYGVTWTESRKNITFICPNGMKCRDKKLGDCKYLKDNMDAEMMIRRNICLEDYEYEFPEIMDTGWEEERRRLFENLLNSQKISEEYKAHILNLMNDIANIFRQYSENYENDYYDEVDIDKKLRSEIRAVKNGFDLVM